MTDYYNTSDDSSRKARKRGPLLLRIFDILMIVVSAILVVVTLLTYLAPAVNPHRMWMLAFMGLGAPITYLLLLTLILYWIVRWRWKIAGPMILVALIGVGKISRFYRINPVRDYSEEQPAERGAITVMSYNVGGFLSFFEEKRSNKLLDAAALIDSIAPDILCMQEFLYSPSVTRERLDTLLQSHDYRQIVGLRVVTNRSLGYGSGNAIFTRYRVLDSGVIDADTEMDSTKCISMWADLLIGNDTVRVVNNHLRTTSITREDHEYLVNGSFIDDESKLRGIASRLRNNFRIRADQADTISRFIAASPYAVIVCGDFNDGPMTYTYNRIRGDLQDTFVESGRGAVNTYRGFFNLLRIDFTFVDDRFEVLSFDSPREGSSDHYPVVSRIRLRDK